MPHPARICNVFRPYCVVEVDPVVPVPVVPVPVVAPPVVPVLPVVVESVVPVVPVAVPVVVVLWVASPVFSAVDSLLSHAASGAATDSSTIVSSDSLRNVASLAKLPSSTLAPTKINTSGATEFHES